MAQTRGRRSILKLVHDQSIAVVLILSYLWLGCYDRCEACSSVAFDNGTTVFATNYDNQLSMGLLFVNVRGQVKSGLSAGTNGQTASWKSRYASITFNAAGYQQPWAGMNEQGLVFSTMALAETVPPDPDERLPIDFGPFWMQYMLDTCATVEDVIAADAEVRVVSTVDHYLIADRNGRSAVIEFLDGETVVHSGATLSVPVLTNAIYEDMVESWNGYLESGASSCTEAFPYGSRFCQLAEMTSNFQPTSTEDAVAYAFDALQNVGTFAQWSVVFDTGTSSVYFKTKLNPTIRSLNLHDFATVCPASVQMAEINSLPTGDISNAFFDLSLPMCLDHLLQYLEAIDSEVPPETAEQLFAITAGFVCKNIRSPSGRVRCD